MEAMDIKKEIQEFLNFTLDIEFKEGGLTPQKRTRGFNNIIPQTG